MTFRASAPLALAWTCGAALRLSAATIVAAPANTKARRVALVACVTRRTSTQTARSLRSQALHAMRNHAPLTLNPKTKECNRGSEDSGTLSKASAVVTIDCAHCPAQTARGFLTLRPGRRCLHMLQTISHQHERRDHQRTPERNHFRARKRAALHEDNQRRHPNNDHRHQPRLERARGAAPNPIATPGHGRQTNTRTSTTNTASKSSWSPPGVNVIT
jgi:hypothetical protein